MNIYTKNTFFSPWAKFCMPSRFLLSAFVSLVSLSDGGSLYFLCMCLSASLFVHFFLSLSWQRHVLVSVCVDGLRDKHVLASAPLACSHYRWQWQVHRVHPHTPRTSAQDKSIEWRDKPVGRKWKHAKSFVATAPDSLSSLLTSVHGEGGGRVKERGRWENQKRSIQKK